MRILHVASEYPPQQVFGLGRYVCDLSREMVRQGNAVHVLTNSLGGRDQDVVQDGVDVHRVHFPPPPKPPGPCAPLLAFNLHLQQRATELGFVGLGEPEVVVSHDWLTALAGHRLAARFDLPHVWTVHDTVAGKRTGRSSVDGDDMAFEIERWVASCADLILANSKAIREELKREYAAPAPRVKLVHCGIEPNAFVSSQEQSRIDEFRRFLVGDGTLLVTYVGRLDMEKGIDTLVNAFARLRTKVPGARLAVAGKGVLEETILKHVQQLGIEHSVRLCGYVRGEVLKHVYIASDIHVCPSNYEPFGLVAAEAMAAGTATVVSATGGLTEVVCNPQVGRTFASRSVDDLASVLIELAESPAVRKRLGDAGARHVRDTFAWTVIAPKAERLYREACRDVKQEVLV